jgi:Holliday junction resolvasome RuvABC endonuclease subunit
MGIDPSTRRMSAAVLVPYNQRGDRAFEVDTLSLPQLDGNESRRLALQQTAIVPWMGGLLERWDPCMVVIEEPFAGTIGGAVRVPKESYHVIGILLAVLGQFGVRVERIAPAVWKKAALGAGKGGVRKPKRNSSEEYEVLTWARAAGYQGSSWDESDAIGIATAGGVLLERESRNL